jgi:hypothetical protein
MAIKRKASATYIADTGKEFEVSDMTDSHLLNAICHHLKQIDGLEVCEKYASPPHHLIKRRELLQQTVQILAEELQTRDPDTEDQRRKEFVEKKWGVKNDDY